MTIILLAFLCKKSISFCKKISLLGTPSSGRFYNNMNNNIPHPHPHPHTWSKSRGKDRDKGKGRDRGSRGKALPQRIEVV
jgi:hypothetical protein